MKIYPLGLFGLFALASCSKSDHHTDNRAFTNLTDKYFILTNSISDPAFPTGTGTFTTDVYHDVYHDACILDDLRMFKSNGEYLNDNGATKCDPSEQQTATLHWRFIADNSQIETTQAPTKDTLTILINDGTTLKYTKIVRWPPGAPTMNYLWTETWIKQ